MRVDNEVLNVLSAAECIGNNLKLVGTLDRNLYTRTNKVLEAAGGKWNRSAKAHIFGTDASDRIEQIILTGDVVVPKDDFEFFPTPASIVERIIDESALVPEMRVLEPSAGHGSIAFAAAKFAPDVSVHMYELMPANVEFLKAKCPAMGIVVGPVDFLTVAPAPEYDRVLMNPPFGKQADIHHVLHALKFLATDGLLVAVMSASVEFRSNKLTVDFRNLVESRGGVIERLPDASFKESGTMVNTVIVVIPN